MGSLYRSLIYEFFSGKVRQDYLVKRTRLSSLPAAIRFAVLLVGCKEKPMTEQVVGQTGKAAEEVWETIKKTTNKSEKAVQKRADEAWEGIKKAAQQVSHVAANVASQVWGRSDKIGDKIKDATE